MLTANGQCPGIERDTKTISCFRSRFNLDPSWSETGDRYMLKLFRDYLFHSVADDGRPWLDHAHIVQCLNRLDAGTMEKVSKGGLGRKERDGD